MAILQRLKKVIQKIKPYPREYNDHYIFRCNPTKKGDHDRGYWTDYDYYCEQCDVLKSAPPMFNEFKCGEEPDLTVTETLSGKVTNQEDRHTYEFNAPNNLPLQIKTGKYIDTLPVGDQIEITIESQNDSRTVWQVKEYTRK